MEKPFIRVAQTDWNRLHMIANSLESNNAVANELLNELERAQVVPDAEKMDFIGLGSTATYRTTAHDQRTVTLVLPADADIARGRISIMTPVGVALLGLSAGQSIEWQTRDGRTETLTVLSVNKPPPEDNGPKAA